MAPQSKKIKTQKKQTAKHYEDQFLNTKKFLVGCY
jgi:hypothetical protein